MGAPSEKKLKPVAEGETKPFDIHACVAEMGRIIGVPLMSIADQDGAYRIVDLSCRQAEEVAFGVDPLAVGRKILTLRADPKCEGIFLAYFVSTLGGNIRSTGLRYCWQGGIWRADFSSTVNGNGMEVSRDGFDGQVVPLAVAECDGKIVVSSPEGLFRGKVIRLTPESEGRFSTEFDQGKATRIFVPGYYFSLEPDLYIYGSCSGMITIDLRGKVVVRLHPGDLSPATVLIRALFEPDKLADMVSASSSA